MGVAEYTLLADAVGTNVTSSLTGVEIANAASRRVVECSEVTFCRLQFASNNATSELETQYSLDDGATWIPMIVRFKQAGVPLQGNQNSGWSLVPDAALGRDIMTRAVLFGDGSPTRVTYLSLQFR